MIWYDMIRYIYCILDYIRHDFVTEILKQWSTQMKKFMQSQLMFFSYQVNQTFLYCLGMLGPLAGQKED